MGLPPLTQSRGEQGSLFPPPERQLVNHDSCYHLPCVKSGRPIVYPRVIDVLPVGVIIVVIVGSEISWVVGKRLAECVVHQELQSLGLVMLERGLKRMIV